MKKTMTLNLDVADMAALEALNPGQKTLDERLIAEHAAQGCQCVRCRKHRGDTTSPPEGLPIQTREVPSPTLREEVARVIDPDAFRLPKKVNRAGLIFNATQLSRQMVALTKADAILSLLFPTVGGGIASSVADIARTGPVARPDGDAEPSGPVAVFFQEREDGGLRVWSDDEPGLVLSGLDTASVSRDVWVCIKALRAFRADRGAT